MAESESIILDIKLSIDGELVSQPKGISTSGGTALIHSCLARNEAAHNCGTKGTECC